MNSDTANTPKCLECGCLGFGVHLAGCSITLKSNMPPIRISEMNDSAIQHEVHLRQDFEKECRDAWVQFACAEIASGGVIVDAAERADLLLEEFKKRFEPKEEK